MYTYQPVNSRSSVNSALLTYELGPTIASLLNLTVNILFGIRLVSTECAFFYVSPEISNVSFIYSRFCRFLVVALLSLY